jgi:hypothetical protein
MRMADEGVDRSDEILIVNPNIFRQVWVFNSLKTKKGGKWK